MITVFLVDDHEVARRGAAALLGEHPDITVVGTADTSAAALARNPATTPTVALLDVSLPDGNGIELCRQLSTRRPKTRCVMLAELYDEQTIVGAAAAGAHGFLGKEASGAQIVHAVREAAAGRSLLDPYAAALMARGRQQEAAEPDPVEMLTEREREVMAHVGQGLTNREIGTRNVPGREDHQEPGLRAVEQARCAHPRRARRDRRRVPPWHRPGRRAG